MSAITAHTDENQNNSLIGVQGTLGTADTGGTALTIPIGVDPATGAAYVYNLGPAGSVSLGNITGGTINRIDVIGTMPPISMGDLSGGTINLLQDGTVGVKGTVPVSITSGTMQLSGTPSVNVVNGSIVVTTGTTTVSGTPSVIIKDPTGADLDLFKQGDNFAVGGDHGLGILALKDGTPKTYQFLRAYADGDLGVDVDTITTGSIVVTAGTIASVGTVPGIGVVGNVNGGSIVITNGTVVGNVASSGTDSGNPIKIGGVFLGTPATLTDGQRGNFQLDNKQNAKVTLMSDNNTFSIANLADNADAVGTSTNTRNLGVMSRNTVFNGASWDRMYGDSTTGIWANVKGGTIGGAGVVGNVNNGSIVVTVGTVKNDGRPARNILSFGTTFGGTAAGYGTLVGSAAIGAGTSLWVNDVSIVNNAGTLTAMVGFGTALNGTSVLAKGNFSAQGGIQKSFPLAVNAGMTNSDLVCYISAAGTIDVTVSYFISA